MVMKMREERRELKKNIFSKVNWKNHRNPSKNPPRHGQYKPVGLYVLGSQLRHIIIIYMSYRNKKDEHRKKQVISNKFCQRTQSQPKSMNYSTKTVNMFRYGFFPHCAYSKNNFLQLVFSIGCNLTDKQNEPIKKAIVLTYNNLKTR